VDEKVSQHGNKKQGTRRERTKEKTEVVSKKTKPCREGRIVWEMGDLRRDARRENRNLLAKGGENPVIRKRKQEGGGHR